MQNFRPLAKNIIEFGTNKSGTFANMLIDQYKNSKKLFIITFVPNQIYCLAGYWIEKVNLENLNRFSIRKANKK